MNETPTCNTNVEDCAPYEAPVYGPRATPSLHAATFVEMESASIYSLGYNLAGRLGDFDRNVELIKGQLTNNTEYDAAQGEVNPIARDKRWVHAVNAANYHTESMKGNAELLKTFRDGMDRLSRLTRIIVNEVGGIDAQNKMTMEDLEVKTGLNKNNATTVDHTYSPGSPTYNTGPGSNRPNI